jgi:hypothetical protein
MSSTYPSPAALTPPTVSNASVAVAGLNLSRIGLYAFNPSSTVTLWVSPSNQPAAVNGTCSIAVQPLQGVMLGPPNMPGWTNGLNAIASSAGPNVISLLEFTQ